MKKIIFSFIIVLTLLVTSFSASAAVLKVGSRGNEVSLVQQTLKNEGYFYSSVTGYYGSITKNAVIKFQRDRNLVADGIVGYRTQRALYKSRCPDKWNSNDVFWLSRLIEAEAKGESFLGKVAVGNSVVNRVRSPEFPNTIEDIVFDTKYGVQYQPISNGTIYNNPSADSIKAAQQSLLGSRPVGNSLYFYNPKTSTNNWISRNRTYHSTIGNHNFHL